MPKNQPPDPETLRRENEQRRLQLEQQYGALFGASNPDLPPEIENQFLRNILEFEKQLDNREQISIYDFIGRPAFRLAVDCAGEDECSSELDRLLIILEENGIVLNVLGQYPASVIYRFVTEELFPYEKDNIRLPGFTSNFIYEEFHPNHALDLEDRLRQFFESLTYLDTDWTYFPLRTEVHGPGRQKTTADFLSALKEFQGRFSRLEVRLLDITSLDFDLDAATGQVSFNVMLEGRLQEGQSWQAGGSGRFGFGFEYDCWCIGEVDFPGFPGG